MLSPKLLALTNLSKNKFRAKCPDPKDLKSTMTRNLMQAYKNCPKFKEDKPSTSPILVRA